jgi:hypothetical protein
MFSFDFSTFLCEAFLILITERDIIVNVGRSSYKIPVILVKVLMKLEFSRGIFEKFSNIKFHENSPVIAELFHAYGRTDRQTLRSQ